MEAIEQDPRSVELARAQRPHEQYHALVLLRPWRDRPAIRPRAPTDLNVPTDYFAFGRLMLRITLEK